MRELRLFSSVMARAKSRGRTLAFRTHLTPASSQVHLTKVNVSCLAHWSEPDLFPAHTAPMTDSGLCYYSGLCCYK